MPFHFEQIPSTQTFLKELVLADPKTPHLEYALSDSQTGGMGRMGRSWVSDPGNLYLSVWIRTFSLPLTWIPHWVGVSLLASFRQLRIPCDQLTLKWPNDLVFNRTQKVAGILCEKVGDGVVAGIGVNLISAPDIADRETASVSSFSPGLEVMRMNIALTETLVSNLSIEPEPGALENAYQRASLLKPNDSLKWVDLQTKAEGKGRVLRYGNYGELIVIDESGCEKALYSEEIRLQSKLE